MIKEVKNLKDVLNTISVISKLLKFTPKREALFNKLKEDLAPEFPSFRTSIQCPWWFSAECYWQLELLQELWDECLETKLEPVIKGCIIGVKHQMGTFDYFYGVHLGGMLLKHSDNLSCAIQTSHMSAAESQLVAALTTKTLTKVRTEEAFSLFWERWKKAATELEIKDPVLLRKRQCPIRYFLEEAPSEFHDSVKHYYRQINFESIDTAVNCIKSRFEQKDYVNWYAKVESPLLIAAKGEPFD